MANLLDMDLLSSLPELDLSPNSVQSAKQGAAVLVVTWIVWRLLKAATDKNPVNKIPGPKSESIITGNILKLFNPNAWDYHAYLTREFPSIARVPTGFGNCMLYTKDPEAMYHILVKDHSVWDEPEDFILSNNLLLGPGLLATVGEQHRRQRRMLTPVFSIAHMRNMIPIFYEVVHRLCDSIKLQVAGGETEVDMSSWMTRTALELIGQSGLGFPFDNLALDGVMHPYGVAVKSLMSAQSPFAAARVFILPRVAHIGTPGFRRRVVNMLPWKAAHVLRDVVDVMHNTSVEIIESKKRALEGGDQVLREQVNEAKDVMSILLKANMAASEEDRLPDEELIGQMTTISFAATDTTSNALSRILQLLSEHQDVQDRLRQEIMDAKNQNGGADLSYDELVQLPYLDAVCRESLRMYPPVPFLVRRPLRDVVLPMSLPFQSVDGKEMHEVVIPKDTVVLISVTGSNKNQSLWGLDAEEWKPERWLSPLPDALLNARIPGVYSHLMTFAGGGRSCIGFKFSQLEMKAALCLLLESFKFSPAGKTIHWQYNGVAQPAIEDPETKQTRISMPLKVSLVAS